MAEARKKGASISRNLSAVSVPEDTPDDLQQALEIIIRLLQELQDSVLALDRRVLALE